jgi:organic radical activating enzyme
MNFNIESFCPEPWSQIEINPQGDFKVCCLANYDNDYGLALDKNGKAMNILTHEFEEALNSETHKQHRLEYSQNIKVKRCRNCYDSEESTDNNGFGPSSKRQRVIKITSKSIPEYETVESAANNTADDGSIISPNLINLDIRFGNLCNQKCIMCGPVHSSQWYDDHAAINYQEDSPRIQIYNGKHRFYTIEKNEYNKFKMNEVSPWWESDVWWNKFDKIAPQLRYIYFTGGEPLLVPAMQECLDRLIKNGYAKNIELRYDTNLSVINKKVIDKWKYFKDLFLCVSVDDTNERHELIRFPSNYNTLIENINLLKNNGLNIYNLTTCIGIATPYAITRLVPLSKQLDIKLFIRFIETPEWLNLRNLPKMAKIEIITNLIKHRSDKLTNRYVDSEIYLLKKYLNYENLKHVHEFVRIMDILDTRRGTNWRLTLPDTHAIIEKYCNK